LRASLLPGSELFSKTVSYLPLPFTTEHYRQLFALDSYNANIWNEFRSAFLNSLISSIASTVLTTVIALLSGYAFARVDFKGKNTLFAILIATMAIPVYAVLIPLYRLIIVLGLVDTQTGITLIYTAAYAPLALWIMRNYFDSIPVELEEAAYVDGASRLRAMLLILPLAIPGVITVAMVIFLSCWSQFVLPLIFSPVETKPLTVLITQYVSKSSINYGLMMASGMFAILPPVLIVIFLNKFLVGGLMTGAFKK
jgi:multiple sugar transport system permease protein